jgi:uncharacterized protein YegL
MARNDHDFSAEEPSNHAQKTILALVLDTSSSMEGDPIRQLNEAVRQFFASIREDASTADRLEVAIVSFNSKVKVEAGPGLTSEIDAPVLDAYGSTHLVDGVREGISVIRGRKAWYKQTGQQYLRPWIIMITDGEPTPDGQDIKGLTKEIHQGVESKEFVFRAIGVDSANMHLLGRISHPSMPPAKLKGLQFNDLFQWLSQSMQIVASSREGDTVNFPAPTWMQGVKV